MSQELNDFFTVQFIKHNSVEFVGEVQGIKFVNYSKCVSAMSGEWALKQISCPIILIAGGADRNDSFQDMVETVRLKVKKMILIGQTRKRFQAIFNDITQTEEAMDMDDAIKKAIQSACPGDCVLLAPMCPSYDMFKNYIDRGERFEKAVGNLVAQEQSKKEGVRKDR